MYFLICTRTSFQLFQSFLPRFVRTPQWPQLISTHIDRVSTYGCFQVAKVVLVWVFGSVGSPPVLSSPLRDFLQLSSASISKFSTKCCLLLTAACEVNVAATSDLLLLGCNTEMALFAHVFPLAFETADPRVATCYTSSTFTATPGSRMNAGGLFFLGGLGLW